MKKLNQTILAVCVLLVSLSSIQAQNFYPAKDLAFAQIAVGDTIQTRITLTNRGGFAYTGKLLFRRGDNLVWNPIVDGKPISDGEITLSIDPDVTQTLLVTGPGLQAGTALLVAEDLLLDNFVEANLTYQLKDGIKIVDSVGVSPSGERYLASIPFDQFDAVALALGNGDLTETLTANVRLDLLDEQGNFIDSTVVDIKPLAHRAKFLSEDFPGAMVEAGKIEIYSRVPFYGTALQLEENQISSLPLEPAPIAYNLRMVASNGTVWTGDISLLLDGFVVKGLLMLAFRDDVALDAPTTEIVTGRLIDGTLRLTFAAEGPAFFDEEVLLLLNHPSFFADLPVVSGTWLLVFTSDQETWTGTYELNRTTP